MGAVKTQLLGLCRGFVSRKGTRCLSCSMVDASYVELASGALQRLIVSIWCKGLVFNRAAIRWPKLTFEDKGSAMSGAIIA